MNGINGFHYIGKLTGKNIQEYEKKDGGKGLNYNLNFAYLGGFQNIRCSKEVYEKLEENKEYILPVGVVSKKNIDFVSVFIREKNCHILDIEGNIIE